MNIQDWFPLEWTDWIFLQSKGLSKVFSNTTVQKHQFLSTQLSLVHLSHPYMTTGKTIALTRWTFVGKVMSLLLNMLSRLVITFLPRSKRLSISWLQSPSAVTSLGMGKFLVSPGLRCLKTRWTVDSWVRSWQHRYKETHLLLTQDGSECNEMMTWLHELSRF